MSKKWILTFKNFQNVYWHGKRPSASGYSWPLEGNGLSAGTPSKKGFFQKMWFFGDLGFPSIPLFSKPLKALCLSFKMVNQHLLYLLSLWTCWHLKIVYFASTFALKAVLSTHKNPWWESTRWMTRQNSSPPQLGQKLVQLMFWPSIHGWLFESKMILLKTAKLFGYLWAPITVFWACHEKTLRTLRPESFCAWKVATRKVLGFSASVMNFEI